MRRFGSLFEKGNDARSVFIGRSNKQVLAMNLAVRRQLFGWNVNRHLLSGDMLIANQNCIIQDEVLFSGSPVWVDQCGAMETFAGVHYLNTQLSFRSVTGEIVTVHSKVVLDSLVNETGQLPVEKRKAIVHEAMKRNSKYRETKRPSDDSFVGALNVLYGYALICHKAQGGEWQHVFLNPMYGEAEGRWLYTAVTRASEQFYSWQ
jgi:exodeoxyribonuclease-5